MERRLMGLVRHIEQMTRPEFGHYTVTRCQFNLLVSRHGGGLRILSGHGYTMEWARLNLLHEVKAMEERYRLKTISCIACLTVRNARIGKGKPFHIHLDDEPFYMFKSCHCKSSTAHLNEKCKQYGAQITLKVQAWHAYKVKLRLKRLFRIRARET